MPSLAELTVKLGSSDCKMHLGADLIYPTTILTARETILSTAVCWLKLDETSGTNAANEVGSDGTIVNGFTSVSGLIAASGNAFEFDGNTTGDETQQLINVPDSLTLTDWTIQFLAKPANTSKTGYINDFSGIGILSAIINFTSGQYNINSSGYPTGTQADSNIPISGAGVEDHVAWVKSGSTLQCYLNGYPQFSPALTLATPSNWTISGETLRIGDSFYTDATDGYEGALDDFAIFDSALSEANIQILADELYDPSPPPTGYFVSPTGGTGTGEIGDPWSIDHLATRTGLTPGSTIWVRGGTYYTAAGDALFEISTTGGTLANPLVLRSYPGEWAVIDTYDVAATSAAAAGFKVNTDHFHLRELEIMNSRPDDRWTTNSDQNYPDTTLAFNRGQFFCDGDNVKVINCIIHDLINGYASNTDDTGGGLFANIVYNNGFIYFDDPTDRGRDHGLYVQNDANGGTYTVSPADEHQKQLLSNLSFNNFQFNYQIYGTGAGNVLHMLCEDNIAFNCGYNSNNYLFGAGTVMDDIVLRRNYSYQVNASTGYIDRVGSGTVTNDNWTFEYNYFASGRFTIQSGPTWTDLTASNNNIIGDTLGTTTGWGLTVATKAATITAAVNVTKVSASPTTDTHRFPGGYGFVAIYNWAGDATVDVDLSDILSDGASYKIWHAYDIEDFLEFLKGNASTPELSGTFSTASPDITFTMSSKSAPTPLGDLTGHSRVATSQTTEYGAYIVATYDP